MVCFCGCVDGLYCSVVVWEVEMFTKIDVFLVENVDTVVVDSVF